MMNRRKFLKISAALPLVQANFRLSGQVMTVNGPLAATELGLTLIHEHILVDFVGADAISDKRWNREKVRKAVLPYLLEAKARGVQSMLDCTPAFLGRDVRLLREMSKASGLHILTNTGYYGAVNNKYLPPWAFTETDEQLARRWIREWEEGMEGTDIKPGFIKIGVNSGSLSPLHQKLVRAAGITHLHTGLTICSHTGPALPAFEEIELLKSMHVSPEAFVWVHAQQEEDKRNYEQAARQKAWVSLDGMGWGDFEHYADWLLALKEQHRLPQVLVSHDAGWYTPQEPDPMAKFVAYTHFFDQIKPLLEKRGFTSADFHQLLVQNPATAFTIGVRKI